jgi:hypothetical protein
MDHDRREASMPATRCANRHHAGCPVAGERAADRYTLISDDPLFRCSGRGRGVGAVRAPSSFSSAPRQPLSQYRRIMGVSCGLIADESCYSRSVNPFSSVYSTAIRPSCTCATS